MALLYTSSTCYINEGERNIHIWASERAKSNLCLILLGGFYIDPDSAPVLWRDFFTWIEIIISKPRNPAERMCLLPCKDPREHGLPAADKSGKIKDTDQVKTKTQAKDKDYVQEWEHYVLCVKGADGHIRTCGKPHMRSYIVYQPELPSFSRSQTVVKHARIRDGGCLVTGAIAAPRGRGENHTGFHVAHIYPLHWRDTDQMTAFVHGKLLSEKACEMLKDKAIGIDSVGNCIEMQATVHYAYDDFQFSFRPEDLQIHRFESSGGVALNPDITRLITGPVSKTPTYSPEFPEQMAKMLLNFHFNYGIALNCTGGGRDPATNAVKKAIITPRPDRKIISRVD